MGTFTPVLSPEQFRQAIGQSSQVIGPSGNNIVDAILDNPDATSPEAVVLNLNFPDTYDRDKVRTERDTRTCCWRQGFVLVRGLYPLSGHGTIPKEGEGVVKNGASRKGQANVDTTRGFEADGSNG